MKKITKEWLNILRKVVMVVDGVLVEVHMVFKTRALVDFEFGDKKIKKGIVILVPGWMLGNFAMEGKISPINWVDVERGFKCALMSIEELKIERDNKLASLEIKKRKIQNKYDAVINGLLTD
jgi:hypothetical protein